LCRRFVAESPYPRLSWVSLFWSFPSRLWLARSEEPATMTAMNGVMRCVANHVAENPLDCLRDCGVATSSAPS
jgi:hypothetical protein